jgi:7,8-dihydroneopterin aldolase/epimerase/oxygenase
MTDRIIIQELEIDAIVGVYDFERENRQRLLVDLIMDSDFRQAGQSDDLNDTVNYASVAEQITQLTLDLQPQLLEFLAERICQMLFQCYPIQRIELTLKKPDILSNARSVGVHVIRHRQDQ